MHYKCEEKFYLRMSAISFNNSLPRAPMMRNRMVVASRISAAPSTLQPRFSIINCSRSIAKQTLNRSDQPRIRRATTRTNQLGKDRHIYIA